MAIPLALIATFGKPVAERIIKGLMGQKDGAQKLEAAGAAMVQGMTAIEALRQPAA